MAFDSRYPWLHRLAKAPLLSSSDRREAERIAKRIGDNTGLSCAFNTRTGDLFFYYRSPHGGPFSMPYYDKELKTCRRYTDHEVGDYIRLAKYGQLDRSEKDAIAEQNKKELKYRENVAVEKYTEERAPCMNDYAGFLSRKRRGTKKVISA